MRARSALFKIFLCLLLSSVFVTAQAEDGVSEKEIRIGIVNDTSGPSTSAANLEYNAAADLYFDKINKAGGINGRQIKVFHYDDAYEPTKAVEQTKKALEADKVFLLMNFVGTPTVKAILPLVEKAQVPFLFARTGDGSVQTFKPTVFNLRQSYQDEELVLIKEVVVKRKQKKLAIFMQEDGFGQTLRAGILNAFSDFGFMDEVRKRGSPFVAEGKLHRNATSIDEGFKMIAKADPEVVFIALPHGPALQFVKKAAAEKKNWQLIAVSNNGSVPEQAGGAANGMLVTQVMPLANSSSLPIVKQFRADMEAAGRKDNINGITLEAYINAVVTVEALKRTGAKPTRAGLIQTLESTPLDIGGLRVQFSPSVHNAKLPISIGVAKDAKLVDN